MFCAMWLSDEFKKWSLLLMDNLSDALINWAMKPPEAIG